MADPGLDRGDTASPTTFDSLIRGVAAIGPGGLVPGDVLDGTYELVERIGGGGMGVVFRARDRRLGRDVAVKVLRPRSAEAEDHLRQLFEREARATAQLLHPNVVTLHHVGEHEGNLYLVLELLAGETLAARLARRGSLAANDALAIVDAILAALAFAHERGVLHRDLKPSNVFITGDERVKVLDFGVSLSLDTDPGPATRSAGTPGYMAPEHKGGGAQDTRTDVWAAALLLVECLLGRRPDDNDAAAALGALQLPAALEGVLARALATDPAKRPASARELRSELQQAGGRLQPAIVRTPTPPRRARLVALVACGIVVGAVATYAILSRAGADHARAGAFAIPHRAPIAEEVSGLWKTNFGEMLLEVDRDGTAYAVYSHDLGILAGTYRDGLFTGRWCELPTRLWPDDGGVIELRFSYTTQAIRLDGTWAYGRWSERAYGGALTFEGSRADTPPSAKLVQQLAVHETCPAAAPQSK